MRLDELDYSYPVVAIREIHLWKPEEASAPPAFHFGIGFGTIIHWTSRNAFVLLSAK